MSTLDLAALEEDLQQTVFAGKLHHLRTIGSTNTLAIAEAQAGAAAGQVYLADEQTAGRGRGGHSWISDAQEGLYMSVLLRPALPAAMASRLSLAMGLVARTAIETVAHVTIDLRWPNDLVTMHAGRKLGGILTESATDPSGSLRFAVVGIGINLNQSAFPGELDGVASSLRMETGRLARREDLIPALLKGIAHETSLLEAGEDTLLERFAEASSFVRGKHVHVSEGDGYTGVTEGLNSAGLLLVRTSDGDLRIVHHGGVRALLPCNNEERGRFDAAGN